MGPVVAAVDFGASSIRVCRVDLGSRPPQLTIVHRHAHQPTPDGRWDWDRLVDEMIRGLRLARAAGPVASIGIDTWGVDYVLLDTDGRLIAPPFSYRDHRTDGHRQILDRLGEVALYRTIGVQLQPFNTLFQVAAHDRAELALARHLLLLPELLVHHLTGEVHAERTSAGTTALVDLATGDWSTELLEAVDVDPALFAPIEPAGTRAGTWEGVPVHLVGGHDTASVVAALDLGPSAAFVSAGTWMLVGREQPAPEVAEWARLANFTNEAGALGGVRFLKNLAGSWLIEGCRPAWGDPPIDDLLAAAAAVEHDGAIVDVTDTRFLHPDDMLGEVTRAAGLPRTTPPPVVVRTIVESTVDGTARVLDRLGLPVATGPVEATALGNALVQGVALGVYADLGAARRRVPRPLSPAATPSPEGTATR